MGPSLERSSDLSGRLLEPFVKCEQPQCYLEPLFLICAQDAGLGFPLYHACKFPAKVVCVLDANVHTLARFRRVGMDCIAS